VRVSYYYGYEGEDRFRATLAAPGLQPEAENNDSTGSATTLAFLTAGGSSVVASVAGSISGNDGGDYYLLGNLAPGTTINLTSRDPGSSTVSAKVEILLGTSTVLLDADGDTNNDRAMVTTTIVG